ncbi:MAG: KH domain-containing protein [Bacillota bacterium]|nr:KH domain-containing protein [Bacillota bacterium]
MKDLILVLTKSLVDDPSQVSVEEMADDRGEVVYEIRVAPDDMGKVIGRQGRVIKAIRTVAKAAAIRTGKRVNVEVV